MNVKNSIDFQDWLVEDFSLSSHDILNYSNSGYNTTLLELPALPILNHNFYQEDIMSLSSFSAYETDAEELWSEQDDEILHKLAGRYRCEWDKVSVFFEGKSEKSVQKRWKKIKDQYKDIWTQSEDRRLMQLREKFGRNFKTLSSYFPHKSIRKIKQRCNQLIKQKETQAVLSLLPCELPIDEIHIEEIYDSFFVGASREEDSTSTDAPEETVSSGKISPDYIIDDEIKVKPHEIINSSEKRKTIERLYRKMFDLETILRDTNQNIIKLAENIEAKQLNCKMSI